MQPQSALHHIEEAQHSTVTSIGQPLFRCPRSGLSREQRLWLLKLQTEFSSGTLRTITRGCLCNSNDQSTDVWLYNEDRYGLPFSTILCRACGLLRTSPMLASESLDRYYGHFYRNIFGPCRNRYRRSLQLSQQLGESQFTWVSNRWLGHSAEALVADYGCGYGGSLVAWRTRGHAVLGYELSHECNLEIRNKGYEVECDECKFLARCGSAGLVLISHVLEHQIDPIGLLRRIAAATPPDAFLYVEVPGVLLWNKLYGQPGFGIQHAHSWAFCLSTLTMICCGAGWSLVAGDEGIRSLWRKQETPLTVRCGQPQTWIAVLTAMRAGVGCD